MLSQIISLLRVKELFGELDGEMPLRQELDPAPPTATLATQPNLLLILDPFGGSITS